MPFGDYSNMYGGYMSEHRAPNPPALTWDNPEAMYRLNREPTAYERMYEEFLRQQSQIGNRGLDIKQGLLESLAPAITRLLGGGFMGGGGGGYQTDYGAGIYSPMQMTGGSVQQGQMGMTRPNNFRRYGPANYIGDSLGR